MNKSFFKRLQGRGYKSNQIEALFLKALPVQKITMDHPIQKTIITQRSYSIYPSFPMTLHHIKSNRYGGTSDASPKYHMPLPDMRNPKSKEKCNIQRMIIAYRRPMNIGNLLSNRNLDTNPTAPPVSSYYQFD